MSRFSIATLVMCVLTTPFAVFATTTASSTTQSSASTTPITTTPLITPVSTSLSKTAQTRILNLTANLSNREDAAVRRLQNVTVRLESRVQTLEAAGHDMSTAKKYLADAHTSLDLAKSSLATIDKAVASFIGSNNPRESWVNLKQTYTSINSNIRAAYDAVKTALDASLSPLPAVVTSTTTASTTNR